MPAIAIAAHPQITAALMAGRMNTLKDAVNRRIRALYDAKANGPLTPKQEAQYESLNCFLGIINAMYHRTDYVLAADLATLDTINNALKGIPLVH